MIEQQNKTGGNASGIWLGYLRVLINTELVSLQASSLMIIHPILH